MSPSRRGDSGRARTAQERERDRLERERRRARERGASSPLAESEQRAASDGADVHDGEVSLAPATEDRPPARPAAPGVPAGLARASTLVSGAGRAVGARGKQLLERRKARTAADGGQGEPGDTLRPRLRTRTDTRSQTRTGPGRPSTGRVRAATARRPSQVSKNKRNSTGSQEPRSRRGRIAALAALAAAIVALWFLFSLFQPFKGTGHGSVSVEVPRGASSATIGTLLANRGVISSAFFFKLRAALGGKRGQLESGHFDLRLDMSYGAALEALTGHRGTAAQITIRIPEGLSRAEIAPLARHAGTTGDYVRASVHSHVLKPGSYGAPAAAHSLEGFLFPATYDLLPGDPVSKLVNAQLAAFKTNLAKVDLARTRAKRLSIYDVLTIASMVEREAQLASERPLIAAVIYNRLHSGMPLGIDATLRYAIKDYTRPLTVSDLRLRSPYNTRLQPGLPPTPIGNPGLASIEAAAHPAAVPYMYYVVKPAACGQHAFSSTFAQFQQDAARYNNARDAKGGKSPSSCPH